MTSVSVGAADVYGLMVAGTTAHQQKDLASAEACYRAVLAAGPHPGAAALLADVLASRAATEPGLDAAARSSMRAAAMSFARASVAAVDARALGERRALLARHAYFLLGLAGYVVSDDGTPACGALPPAEERASLLVEAIGVLQRVVALDPGYVRGWRNLALALKAAGRHLDAEAALRGAVAASGDAPPWELLYRHGKALKRCGRTAEALARFCDAAEAGGSDAELALFWLRLALAEAPTHPGVLAPALLDRCSQLLDRYGDSSGAPPSVYVRNLFDNYSARFDRHLGSLGYQAPDDLRSLALTIFGEGAVWAACADLGCGTGLAGVAFRSLVSGPLDGCDLSPGMLAEANKRAGLYRLLETGDIVEWLAGRIAGGAYYDLILSCDVLVYVGLLEPLFDAVAHSLTAAAKSRGTPEGAGAPPPAFMFSTEALLDEQGPDVTFELSPAGRCRHSAAYIRRLAAERGLVVHAHARETIREDGGLPVVGDLWVLSTAGPTI